MTIAVDAVYEDGVLEPQRPLQLEEKARVHVIIEVKAKTASSAENDPMGWKAIDRLMGIGKAVAPHVAEKPDEQLYGDARD